MKRTPVVKCKTLSTVRSGPITALSKNVTFTVYSMQVYRYSDQGTLVLVVHATDSANVSYAIEAGDNEGVAWVDEKTGEIRVGEELRTAKEKVQLQVTATDHGTPRLLSRVKVDFLVRNISGNQDN